MGEFIFMKDPNKAVTRLFKVTNTDDNDDDDADEELWSIWIIPNLN